MTPTNRNDNPWRAIGLVSAIGIEIAACVLGGFYLGQFASDFFGGQAIWIAIGVILGLIVGVVGIICIVKRVTEGKNG